MALFKNHDGKDPRAFHLTHTLRTALLGIIVKKGTLLHIDVNLMGLCDYLHDDGKEWQL